MDCIVHGVAKSRTQLSDVHSLTRPGSSSHLDVGRDGAVLQNTGSGIFKGALAPLKMVGGGPGQGQRFRLRIQGPWCSPSLVKPQ